MDWIFYHDVMYKFSIEHWQTKNEDQKQLAAQEKIISKAIFSPERQVVRTGTAINIVSLYGNDTLG